MSIAIVDYGLGNLFSIRNACARIGLTAVVSSRRQELLDADGLILPGVGAFGDAMTALRQGGLADALKEYTESQRPVMGICLGMQLLMTESFEFGQHAGLDLIPGQVVRLAQADADGNRLKVPNVGWSRIEPGAHGFPGTPLQAVARGAFMYFVHSYHCVPTDASVVVSTSGHGSNQFVSAVQKGCVFGCQFHPEKSGPEGVEIYRGFAELVARARSSRTLPMAA